MSTYTKVQLKILEKFKEHGNTLISFEKGRKVIFICNCGNHTQSDTSNICKETWTGSCAKCSNKKRGNQNNIEHCQKIFADGGEILPDQPYIDNKSKLHYCCSFCNETAHVSLSEFSRGRRCENCAKTRMKETNLEKYGVENVFQSEIIKDKIKENNIKKYGVDHHMKVKEILQQTIQTHTERYGYKFAFHSELSIKKGRKTCKLKYGKEFPLQVKQIQEKIKQKCKENLGVEYPLQSKNINCNARKIRCRISITKSRIYA
jgi:hypothetical protein